jgi:uncharacterized membrane protein
MDQPSSPTPIPTPAPTPAASGDQNNKLWAILGYIIPILFFVPLLGDQKNNPYVRWHANQQLDLLLFWIVVNVVLPMIPLLGWALIPIAYIFGLVLMIMGIMNAQSSDHKRLPLIGKLELLK